jgi:hypothetical protein
MAPKRKRVSAVRPAATPDNAYESYKDAFNTAWQAVTQQLAQRRSQASNPEPLADVAGLLDPLRQLPSSLANEVLLSIRDGVLLNFVQNLLQGEATDYALVYDVLDALLLCASSGICTETLPHTTLELLFETETVQGAEKLFDFVESRSDQITAVRLPLSIAYLRSL